MARISQAIEQRFHRLRPLTAGPPEMRVPQIMYLIDQAWTAANTGQDPEPLLHQAELAAGLGGLADELRACGNRRCQEWIQPEKWDDANQRVVWRRQCVYCGRKYTQAQSAAGTVAAASKRRPVMFREDSPALFPAEEPA